MNPSFSADMQDALPVAGPSRQIPVMQAPPLTFGQPQHSYPSSGSHHVPHPSSGVTPIPAVNPKIAYDAPVFRTFQDRKREKERERMAQHRVEGDGSHPTPPTVASPARLNNVAAQSQASPVQPTDSPRPPNDHPPTHSQTRANGFASSIPPTPPARRPLPTPSPSHATPTTPFANDFSPSSPGFHATVERSDTISSIRSLDRMGFPSPSKRPLPKPPVSVNSSKSLDRGNMGGARQSPRWTGGRKQPSVVQEEDEDARSPSPSPVTPTKSSSVLSHPPHVASASPMPAIPMLVEPGPAKDHVPSPPTIAIQVPTLNLPSDDEEDSHTKQSESPSGNQGVVFSGLPVIAVSTEHSDDTPSTIPRVRTSSNDVHDGIPSQVHPTQAIICAGCGHPIIGRIVNAMRQRWHPACFKCDECGELLEHVSSFEWEGKAYCHLDYHDKFAHRCFHCKTPIVDSRFVTLNDPVLGERFYHELHFFCSECGDPFLDPSKSSAPGGAADAQRGDEEEDGETNPFVIHKGHPYCERCHIRLHKPKCKSCHQPIPDIAVNAMGAKWHQGCFVCSGCGGPFANNLFFPKDGQALCTSCYERDL